MGTFFLVDIMMIYRFLDHIYHKKIIKPLLYLIPIYITSTFVSNYVDKGRRIIVKLSLKDNGTEVEITDLFGLVNTFKIS